MAALPPPRWLDAREASLRLRCPRCIAGLSSVAGGWVCTGPAGHSFPEVDGRPILINPDRSLFRCEDFRSAARTTFKSPSAWALRLGRWLPSPSRDVSASACQVQLARWLSEQVPERRRVLVVGSGDGTAGYGEMAAVGGVAWLETDVSLAGNARIVCDASDLPFEDASFDLVICVAVLEHVLEPQRCVNEFHRVLSEGGMVYVTTPFMQQVHMGEYDFTRFTRSGHRWLFRYFDEVGSGMATGPASVLIWSIEYFLMAWTSSVAWRRIIKGATRLLLGWMTVLDTALARRVPAFDGAGGFFFIGRRSVGASLHARDMLRYYRGADAEK